MASRLFVPIIGVCLLAGCSTGDDNSPDVGKVAPKPNPNMNAQLPESIREQMQQAKPGADAAKMGAMRKHQ